MQTRNPLFDDLSRMVSGATGAAQAAGDEVKTLFRSQTDRVVADMDLASREEVEALKGLLQTALERIETLEKQVAELTPDKTTPRGKV